MQQPHPVWPWTATDLLATLIVVGIVAACCWYQPVLGVGLAWVVALAGLRTGAAIRCSGLHGIRPSLAQKMQVGSRALGDVLIQNLLALFVLAAGFFFYALGSAWYEFPQLANLSSLLGVLLMAVGAPAIVLYLFWQLPTIDTAPPKPTSAWMRWAAGILSLAVVNALLIGAAAWTWQQHALLGLAAAACMLPCLVWGTWGSLLELRGGFAINPLRVAWLILRGLAVLIESLVMGSALAAAGFVLIVLAANGDWGFGFNELFRWGGISLAVVGTPLLAMAWWWRLRPRLVQLREFPLAVVEILRRESRRTRQDSGTLDPEDFDDPSEYRRGNSRRWSKQLPADSRELRGVGH